MTPRPRRIRGLAAATLAVVLTAGTASCGLSSGGAVPLRVGPGTVAEVASLKDVPVTVGGKDFTEGVVLSYLLEFVLAAAGMNVKDLSSLAGSSSFRQAMIAGQVDAGLDYTGTAWMTYLGHERPIPDNRRQWEAVRDEDATAHDLVWLPAAEVDNTYALAMNARTAQSTGVVTLSDYAELVKRDPTAATACLETEFNVRRDGFPGMAEHYGFPATAVPVSILQTGIIYQATAAGTQCAFGEVFTTDGRVKGLNLTLVADDKQFFPKYNVAPVIRGELMRAHPEIADVVAPLTAVLDNDAMMALNARVDIDGDDPAVVARDFLVEKGLVTAG